MVRRPTPTSDATMIFRINGKGSNERRTKCDTCIADILPHSQTKQINQTLAWSKPLLVPRSLTVDTAARTPASRKHQDRSKVSFWPKAHGSGLRTGLNLCRGITYFVMRWIQYGCQNRPIFAPCSSYFCQSGLRLCWDYSQWDRAYNGTPF